MKLKNVTLVSSRGKLPDSNAENHIILLSYLTNIHNVENVERDPKIHIKNYVTNKKIVSNNYVLKLRYAKYQNRICNNKEICKQLVISVINK